MPEGHIAHRSARDIGGDLAGQRVRVTSPQGRFAAEAATLDDTVLADTDAYGKHLFLRFASGATVHVHLGTQGTWLRSTDPASAPRPQVRLRIASNEVAWDLVAPGACELLDEPGVDAIKARLGPDPLRDDADEDAVVAALVSASRPIGAVLLDQKVISGVGNVFRSEALHAAGIAPGRPGRHLSAEDGHQLWRILCRMMRQAVADGRIVTVDTPDRLELPESETRKVYRQTHCRDCGTPVVTSVVGGRTAYHCPKEQPE